MAADTTLRKWERYKRITDRRHGRDAAAEANGNNLEDMRIGVVNLAKAGAPRRQGARIGHESELLDAQSVRTANAMQIQTRESWRDKRTSQQELSAHASHLH